MYKVRQGYVVTHLNYVCRAGTEVPASILSEVLKNQSWKIEEIEDGKKDISKEKESTEGNSSNGKKEEIGDLITDRMMTEKETKRKAKE